MIGYLYIKDNPVTHSINIWWPVKLTEWSYVCVYGNRIYLPSSHQTSKPSVETVINVIRRNPDRFWLGEGDAPLEDAIASRLDSGQWLEVGDATKHLSLFGYLTNNSFCDFERASSEDLLKNLDMLGSLKYRNKGLKSIESTPGLIWE